MMRTRTMEFSALILLLVMGFALVQVFPPATQVLSAGSLSDVPTTRFRVYFPLYLASGIYVFPVDYVAPHMDTQDPGLLAKAALEQLFLGPPVKPFKMALVLPKETKVLGVLVEDGVATVNLSRDIMNLNVGSAGEAAVLSAIVNTVCAYPISSVKLQVDGEALETLAGHVDIRGLLRYDPEALIRPMVDVRNHWAGGSAVLLQAMDVVDGFEDATFRPDEPVTRGQFLKILVESLELPDEGAVPSSFPDLENHWTLWYVERALGAGLIDREGYGTHFSPDEVITREEMAYVLVNASDIYRDANPAIDYIAPADSVVFQDYNEIQERYREAALESAKRGLIQGYPGDWFKPKNGLTRGEAVTVVARMMEIKGHQVMLSTPRPGYARDGKDAFVVGAALAFEANVNFKIMTPDGSEALYSYATATHGMGWGVFGVAVKAQVLDAMDAGSMEVFLVSPKDGSETSKIVIPLR